MKYLCIFIALFTVHCRTGSSTASNTLDDPSPVAPITPSSEEAERSFFRAHPFVSCASEGDKPLKVISRPASNTDFTSFSMSIDWTGFVMIPGFSSPLEGNGSWDGTLSREGGSVVFDAAGDGSGAFSYAADGSPTLLWTYTDGAEARLACTPYLVICEGGDINSDTYFIYRFRMNGPEENTVDISTKVRLPGIGSSLLMHTSTSFNGDVTTSGMTVDLAAAPNFSEATLALTFDGNTKRHVGVLTQDGKTLTGACNWGIPVELN